jgi:hypothetical protein
VENCSSRRARATPFMKQVPTWIWRAASRA